MCKEAGITGEFNYRITKGGKTIQKTEERWKDVNSHTGRRTFATLQVLAGTPVDLIMLMTGHKPLESFDKYILLRKLQGEEALKGDLENSPLTFGKKKSKSSPVLFVIAIGIWTLVLQIGNVIPTSHNVFVENAVNTHVLDGKIDADVSGYVSIDNTVDVNLQEIN